MKNTVHNFNAGPSILPKTVFRQASEAIVEYKNSGLSILEIGHRTSIFQEVMDEARALARELMQLDEAHEVLFLHGGASTQFFQVPMNFLGENDLASYADTGVWSQKAMKEARLYGHVEMACSGEENQYRSLPEQLQVSRTAKYLHLTTNNTIYGTQWQNLDQFYAAGVPLVADMSSDILSRDIPFNRFDLIYAGAQKNVGAAGVNLIVINKQFAEKTARKIPSMMDYRNHIDQGSMLNTPPVFAVYICMLTLRWLKEQGGVRAIEVINTQKASLLYEAIDANPVFRGLVAKADRSKMNACFAIDDEALEKEFIGLCKAEGMIGIKGHRSAGGFRISLYNALPLSSVQEITALMRHFATKKG